MSNKNNNSNAKRTENKNSRKRKRRQLRFRRPGPRYSRRTTFRRRRNTVLRTNRSVPIAKGYTTINSNPLFSNESNGTIVVTHTEYLGSISGSADPFHIAFKQPINPGLHEAYPWFSNIAPNYETYSIIQQQYIFKPTCASTTAGYVMIAIDYDSNDLDYTTKIQASNGPNVNTQSWQAAVLKCDHRNLHKFKQYFIRVDSVTGDIKTYDVGKVYVIVGSQANTSAIGELYVHYKIRLITPQVSALSANREFSSQTATIAGNTNDLFGALGSQTIVGNLEQIALSTNDIHSFGPGEYLTNFFVAYAPSALSAISITALNGALLLGQFLLNSTIRSYFSFAWRAVMTSQNALLGSGVRLALPGISPTSSTSFMQSAYSYAHEELFLHNCNKDSMLYPESNIEVFGRKVLYNAPEFARIDEYMQTYKTLNFNQITVTHLNDYLFINHHPITNLYHYIIDKKIYSAKAVSAFVRKQRDDAIHFYDVIDILIDNKLSDCGTDDQECSDCHSTYQECYCYNDIEKINI